MNHRNRSVTESLSRTSGTAELHVACHGGRSNVARAFARSPLRLLTPRSGGQCVWAYTSSFGGGMVAGDCTVMRTTIDAGARCFLSTQSSTKVYRNPAGLPCSHDFYASIGAGAWLVLAPDPVQCFADSSYEQRQTFDLAVGANLVLLDWLSAGRTARGERWSFSRYYSRNEVQRDGRKILIDPLLLDPNCGSLSARYRSGRFNCFASLVLIGPDVGPHARAVLTSIGNQKVTLEADTVFAASPLQEGALLRVAGCSVERVGAFVHQHLSFVSELMSDNPWSRKW